MFHYLVVPDNIAGQAAVSILVKDREALVEAHEMRCDHRPELDRCLPRQKMWLIRTVVFSYLNVSCGKLGTP